MLNTLISNSDIISIRRIIAGYEDSKIIREAADVTGDNKISNSDIITIRRIIAGYEF